MKTWPALAGAFALKILHNHGDSPTTAILSRKTRKKYHLLTHGRRNGDIQVMQTRKKDYITTADFTFNLEEPGSIVFAYLSVHTMQVIKPIQYDGLYWSPGESVAKVAEAKCRRKSLFLLAFRFIN